MSAFASCILFASVFLPFQPSIERRFCFSANLRLWEDLRPAAHPVIMEPVFLSQGFEEYCALSCHDALVTRFSFPGRESFAYDVFLQRVHALQLQLVEEEDVDS